MGGSESGVPDDYKEQHWNRSVAKLFSSAKMTEPLGIQAEFVVPMHGKCGTMYTLISRSGLITGLSHALPDIVYSLDIPNVRINGAISLNPTTAVLWTIDEIIYVHATENEFVWEKTELTITPFQCYKFSDSTVVIVGTNGSIWKHENKESLCEVYTGTGKAPVNFSVSGSSIAIASADDITLFSLAQNTSNVIPGETKDIVFVSECQIVYVTNEDTIKLIKVNESLGVTEEKDLWTKKITRIFKPNERCVMWLCQNELLSYIIDSQRQNPIIRATMPCQTHIQSILQLADPRVIALICSDGNAMVIRHPQYQVRKGEIEFSPMYSYHRAAIKFACTAEEFSFFTYDENGVAVLWESFPDWWAAPFYLGMFDDESNVQTA